MTPAFPTKLGERGAVLAVYLLGRLWQLAMLGPPRLTPDTNGYRLPTQTGWFEFDLVSFSGHSTRPWPLTVLYGIGPNDASRVLLQFAVATAAWGLLLLAIGTRTRWHGGAAAVTMALALSPGVSNWDAVLLGESILTSATAAAVAGVLLVLRGHRVSGLGLAAGAAAFLVICRPVFAPLALLLALVAVIPLARERRARFVAVSVAAVMVLTVAYAAAYNAEIDRQWGRDAGAPHLNGRTVQQFAILAHFEQGPMLIGRMIRDGAPECLETTPETRLPAWEMWHAQLVDCPDGLRWVSDNFTGWLVRYLATHPNDARDYFRLATAGVSHERMDGTGSLPSPVPPAVSHVLFGDESHDAIAALGIVTAAVLVYRRRFPRWPVSGLVAAGVVALAGTALFSALDIARVGFSAAVLVRLGLLLCVLDAVSEPSRGDVAEVRDAPDGS